MTYLTGKSSLMFSAHVSDFMDCPEAPTPLLLAIRLDSSIAWIGIAIDISEGLPVGINDLEARVYGVHGGGKRRIHKSVAGEFFLEREHDQRRPAKLEFTDGR